MRARFRRAALLQELLKPYGLTVHDGGQVPGIQLSTLSGNQTILPNLQALWAEAERLTGAPIDPLDPHFLDGADG